MSVLVDTGVLYAFLAKDDERHEAAVAFMTQALEGRYGAPIVLDLVVSELFTLVRARDGAAALEERAKVLVFGAGDGDRFLWLQALDDQDLLPIAIHFLGHRAKGYSFVDAALVVTRETLGLDAIATFDSGIRDVAPCLPV